ncbi:hypothetical protein [Methyloceanibacter methanicus]|nr:hypothetical protein [Methyloceanibacter methanicus]
MIYFYSCCALNFVPAARVLFESLKQQFPDCRTVLGLADQFPDGLESETLGIDEIWSLDEMVSEMEQPRGWVFRHNVMELATALKPFMLDRLLKRDDCEAAIFLDSDCVVFTPLSPVFDALERASIILTPHICRPHERDEWIFFELNPHKVGIFNLGFIAVKNTETGKRFASWWKHRLRRHCLIEHERGLFTDQKWIDYVPAYFDDHEILRQPTLNFARWNSYQRDISRSDSGVILIDGNPAEFIHFSGFYKVGGYVKGLYDQATKPFCNDVALLDELTDWYAGKLKRDAERPVFSGPWHFGYYDDGTEVSQQERKFFRSNDALMQRFPDPFATAGNNSFKTYYDSCQSHGTGAGQNHAAQQGGTENTAEPPRPGRPQGTSSDGVRRIWNRVKHKTLGLARRCVSS